MLYNENHIVKEAEVLVGEIVDDNVLIKVADIASSIASLAGPGKVGSYLSSAVGKQLVNRVGTGMAVGAAGGLLTAKPGDKAGGAMKGALLGGAAGGAFHAFDSGALSRFNMGGKNLESMAGKHSQVNFAGKALSEHTPEVQSAAHGIMNDIEHNHAISSGSAMAGNMNAHLSNTGGFGGRAANVNEFNGTVGRLIPHSTGQTQDLLKDVHADMATTKYMSGPQKLFRGVQKAFGYDRGAIRHNMELATNAVQKDSHAIGESFNSGIQDRVAALKSSLGSVGNPTQAASASLPHAGGGLLANIPVAANPNPSQTFNASAPRPNTSVAPAAHFNVPQAGQSTPGGIFIPNSPTGTTPKVNEPTAPSWHQKAPSAPVPAKFDPNLAARAAKSGIQLA